ncbi:MULTISPECIES: ImmA/IrrE family metallo-endopeptidase [unclassified Rhodococcus (in: high G+C Gram-positive bacteria)]|jgi:hypothetical protein|uniref:ImmA/IrrE family metallo-endopeptidase n=1 Tax=unclassified Rhodococcus (in: high G+C Gram-positive bacteria) TaxID=192944 RepID=UPI0009EBF59B|nr:MULTISPECIES: ImmA/IrrE family metallo-endopeptidase [unclassified Rhodococcus (in: high G+C Gram-positive bacteria)]MBP2527492.1 hypothetical protein [Rhodococcus sp. PvP104]
MHLRRRVAKRTSLATIMDSIPLTPPWTVEEFVLWLSDFKGKPVTLKERSSIASRILTCGTLYVMDDGLTIMYSPEHSKRHQRQQIFHEIAHILCDHRGSDVYDVPASVLTDGIDEAKVREILYRGSFGTATEAEAELVGTQLAVLSRGSITNDMDGSLHRSASLIEFPHR